MARTVVLVPCSAAKSPRHDGTGRPVITPAGELYLGSLHHLARRAADTFGGRTLIVSGRYGLLPLGKLVETYEQRIDRPGAITPAELAQQARNLELDAATVVALLPNAYAAAIRAAGIRIDVDVLAGSAGIGEQRARLSHLVHRSRFDERRAIAAGAPEQLALAI